MEKAKPIHQEATGIPQQSAESAFQLPPQALPSGNDGFQSGPVPGRLAAQEQNTSFSFPVFPPPPVLSGAAAEAETVQKPAYDPETFKRWLQLKIAAEKDKNSLPSKKWGSPDTRQQQQESRASALQAFEEQHPDISTAFADHQFKTSPSEQDERFPPIPSFPETSVDGTSGLYEVVSRITARYKNTSGEALSDWVTYHETRRAFGQSTAPANEKKLEEKIAVLEAKHPGMRENFDLYQSVRNAIQELKHQSDDNTTMTPDKPGEVTAPYDRFPPVAPPPLLAEDKRRNTIDLSMNIARIDGLHRHHKDWHLYAIIMDKLLMRKNTGMPPIETDETREWLEANRADIEACNPTFRDDYEEKCQLAEQLATIMS